MRIYKILTNSINGKRLSADEATHLFANAQLPELAWTADNICNKLHNESYKTYAIDRNINYTNICVSGCKFCAFYKKPGSSEGYVLNDETIFSKIEEAVKLGATHIMLQGGLNPNLNISYFERLFKLIKSNFNIKLHSLSAPEIVFISKISNLSLSQALARLQNAGLDSLPGGGAEILEDMHRNKVSPLKCSVDEWSEVMIEASKLDMKATATMVFGFGESVNQRINHFERIRDIQDKTNVFTAFIPWPFQTGNTELGGKTVGGHDYLKTLSISRIFFDNIPSIQASWVTQGSAVCQLALRFGANDIGSTMIEENVVAAAGVSFRMSEQDLVNLIHTTGYDAAQRDSAYNIIKIHPISRSIS